MARKKSDGKLIEQYQHKDKERTNNPPVGLVTPETDRDLGKKAYSYDPHLDPQLVWSGKAEHTSFEVPTVSLHVHERIDPKTIINAVQKNNQQDNVPMQLSLFESREENPPIREAIEFYKHPHEWSNRMVAGDSLLVMNSLLEKEGMAGKVQMIYIDPPYGIKYGSNFQPFVNKRDVKDGKDEDLTAEPEMIKAFRDTWELGIHSYLSYLRDRLLLAKELLHESGSVFVQISDENVHLVRELMDEVLERENFASLITFRTATSQPRNLIASVSDYIIWYCKDKNNVRYHHLFRERKLFEKIKTFGWIELEDGSYRRLKAREKDGRDPLPKGRLFKDAEVIQTAKPEDKIIHPVFEGKKWIPPSNKKYIEGIEDLINQNRIAVVGNNLCGKRYEDDFSVIKYTNLWEDTIQGTFELTKDPKKYVVQTNPKVIARCILMTTNPGDLVFDPTCGSGTTAYVAEQWGRRWITCDTSRIAIALAKQRLMTAVYDYYELAYSEEGVSSGFKYKTVPHITLKCIANNEPLAQETLYDQPFVDNSKTRVSGPFTVEAVPAPVVRPISEVESDQPADASISRSGETLRQSEWRDELFRTGLRGKSGERMMFSRLEPLPGTRWLHADGENTGTDDNPRVRVVVSFGPEHAALDQRQVALAIDEVQRLVPVPKIIVFAAFKFDPEAAKDIDETNWPGITLLKAQMADDLLTEDLKKKRASNESFWLIGQPDVKLSKVKEEKSKYVVELEGFDYYNPKTGNVESGGTEKIAMWMLDTDYDGRSLYPRQVFFPLAGDRDGWYRLARNLKAKIDEELIEAYRGTISLPFEVGDNKRVAVKIVDDRGIESLKIIEVR